MRSARLLLTVCLFGTAVGCQTIGVLSGGGALTAKNNQPNQATAGQLPLVAQLPATDQIDEATAPHAGVQATQATGSLSQDSSLVQPSATLANSTSSSESIGPASKPSEQQALQQVLPDLQALLAEDPAAHAVLLQDFGKTDPSMWSALTRRARSKLAYKKGMQISDPQQTKLQLAVAQQKAGEQAIVQQIAAQVNSMPMGATQQPAQPSANQLPSQMLANQMANSPFAAQTNSHQANQNLANSQVTPSASHLASPNPNALQNANAGHLSAGQNQIRQVSHTSDPTLTYPDSTGGRNPNWIDNQHVASQAEQPNRSTASVTVNPYATSADPMSRQHGQPNRQLAAVVNPSQPKAPTPQIIENRSYEREKPTDWRKSLNTAIEVMKSNTPEQPVSTEEAYQHARLRLLQLAAGKEEEAFDSIPGLSSTEQSYWSKQIYSMATLMDVDQQADRKRRATSAAIHQSEALTQLRKLGTLQISNLGFCSEIYGFGAYEPISQPKFLPGAEASLYTEIENYRSDSTERGFHTLIATNYRVEDKSGALVDEGEFPVVEDYCLSQRKDFHITYGVTLPTAIYPGEYYLKLTITDQLGDKIGEDSVPFEIIGQ